MVKSSESYKTYDQVADPNAGTRVPAGKLDTSTDALHQYAGVSDPEAYQATGKEDKGACKRAADVQCGLKKGPEQRGRDLKDNEPHPNSGSGESANDQE
ncbi:MAG: hypothetical protein OK457_00715 [Thaumarchaeota archaeon]|nr:hypothetical protein [Nitrososphaerota archaeon]